MNFTGIILGCVMLCLIGLGFYWVIKLEYLFGAKTWKWILVLGILTSIASLWIPSFWVSALMGIFGGSIVWGATELPEQEKRVRRGLFPTNPKRMEMEDDT